MAYTVNTSAAALNRAFNNANATPTAFAATAAALTADQIAAANAFDDASLTDLALSTKVLTNMGILPSTVAEVVALEAALADYFAGPGKGNRGFVVLQLAEILSGFAATDVFYGAAAAAWNAELTASVADSAAGTFALTTSTTDNLVGGSAADIFAAVTAALSSANTLQATDKINGGAGNDTLNISVDAAFTGFTTGSVAAVETINLTNAGAQTRAFDATGITGATTYSVDATKAAINISDMATGVTAVNLTGQLEGSFTTAFATGAAEISATTNALALGLTGVGADDTVTLTLGSFETLNVTASGTNDVTFGGSTIKAINVAGAGDISIADVSTSLTSFDASASTGDVTADITDTTSTLTKVATGAGDDALTFNESDAAANLTISGGAGTDSLSLTSNGGTLEYTMTGFETLNIDALSTAALTFSARKTTDLATISTDADADYTAAFVNMGAKDYTFLSKGATDSAVTSDHTGATTVTYSAAAANVTAKTSTSAGATYTFSAAAGALNVNVGAYVNATSSAITATKASSVTLKTTSGGSSDETPVERTIFGSTLTAPVATSITVDNAGSLASGSKIDADVATTATVTNGSNAADFELDTPLLTSLTVTSGNTMDMTGSVLTKLESVAVTTTRGTTTLPDLAAATSITATGTGTSSTLGYSKVVIGAVGSTTKDSEVTLTATGLKGGLTVGTVNTAAGYDVTVSASGVSGAVSIGAIGSGDNDDVTITAENLGSTLGLGAIAADGDVTIKADGATGAVTLSTVSGDNVSIDVSDTIAGTSYGAVTALTSATLNLSDLQANTVTVNAKAASTALNVVVNGGIGIDTVTITGVSTQTGITVTGDLAVGSDVVTVNGYASTKTQAIDVSGLTSYTTGTLTGGSGKDTITGGAGADTIMGARGQDTLTGGSGADVFLFNAGDSPLLTPDTITDLKSADSVQFGNTAMTWVGAAGTASATTATTDAYSVASFGASVGTTLTEKVAAIDLVTNDLAGKGALFTYNGSTYLFIDSGSTDANDVVVILTGVSLPTAAVTDNADVTGLSGFGA